MLVQHKNNDSNFTTYFVRTNHKRYIPNTGDRVIGIVEERFGEYYKVNIFGPHPGMLPVLAFEGATKRNRPILHPGTLIYCRVANSFHNRDLDPELSCKVEFGSNLQRRDWMTDESTYGALGSRSRANSSNSNADNCSSNNNGTFIRVSIGLARELLNPSNLVLNELGQSIPYEIAIGVNGTVWVHSKSVESTVVICNAIRNSEVMTDEQTRGMVREMLKSFLSKH